MTIIQSQQRFIPRVGVYLFLLCLALRVAQAAPLASPQSAATTSPATGQTTESQSASAAGTNPAPPPTGKGGTTTTTPSANPAPATTASLPPGQGNTPAGDLPFTIVVTVATRDPQLVGTTATSTTVLTNDFLKNQNYSRVADALNSVPGLAVITSGAPGQVTSVFTRGTNSDQTLLTIDGRRQAPDFSNFYDFTNLTLDNVDQVEVDRTPDSTLEGANAIGGVINLTTLSGRGLITPEGGVGFEAGSFDTFREFAQSLGAAGGFDYGVAFSRQDSHFPEANDSYHNTVYRGNYGYIITPKIYFDMQTSYTSSFTGDPGIISFPDPTATLFRETWNISPRITAQVTDFYTTTFYYNRTQLREVSSDYLNFSHNRSQDNTDSIDWQNDFQLAHNWKITAGLQGDQYHVYDYDDIAGDQDINQDLSNIGGYIQSQYQPITGLNLLSSVRYDEYSQFDGAFSWRQGVTYQTPVTATVLHASVASAYDTPTVEDLYSPGFFGYSVGNPDLKPERSLGWEIGAAQPVWDNRATLSATYFHNDLRNLIDIEGPFDDPVNVGHATTEGVELGVTVQPIKELSANINYTYLTATDDDAQARLLRRPRNSLNFTGTYKPIQPLTISLGGSWVVGREDIDPYSDLTVDAPDYFVLRGNITYQINDHVSVWVRGENLGNTSYQPVLGYPALGRAGYAGIKVTF
jgi:vitamin B12 transporter